MKTAIVTGGVKGIGGAVSQALVTRGVRVVAVTHDPQERAADGDNVSIACLDLTAPDAVARLVEAHPVADILINNAGLMNGFGLDQYDRHSREAIFALNLWAPVELMWAYGRTMGERGGGRIVNNTSIAAHIGHPDIWYGATKAGLLNATKSIARSLGPSGVTANAVAAGPTDTNMLKKIPEGRKDVMRRSSILGRFAQADEVAAAIAWLAMDAPVYVNGICIDVNNGSFMR